MRYSILSATLLIALLASSGTIQAQEQAPAAVQPVRPGPVQKVLDFFEDFFNRLLKEEKDIDPTGTLVAPFADKNVKPLPHNERYRAMTDTNKIAIDQPHRSDKELSDWLSQAVAHVLSFDAHTYNTLVQKDFALAFSPDALAQFHAWVYNSGIMGALQKQDLQLNGFVEEAPFLLNQGLVNGRYRWLFEVPVMVSFMPRGSNQYTEQDSIQSSHLVVTLQVGRVKDSILEHGVAIESWAVRENKKK